MQEGSESDAPRIDMLSDSAMMWRPRKIAAPDLARDFAVTAQAFADSFVQYIAAEEMALDADILAHRRRETCAAVWASIEATFAASGFTDAERAIVLPLVRDSLLPFWHKHCGSVDVDEMLGARVTHYLRDQDRHSQLKTATSIMNGLIAALDADASRLLPVRTLTALLAHRMLSDLRRLEEIKAGCTIG
jgi:hypothetical protein